MTPTSSPRKCLPVLTIVGIALLASSCAVPSAAKRDSANVIQVSVPQQKLAVYRYGELVRTYPVSTSKFGIGDEKGSYRTPSGKLEVAEKIGSDKPSGAVFKSRKWTGEVIKPNAPGRDPIVSRILWLNGLEADNKNAYSRCIYIHGTAAERDIGKPASYGCVRMKSKDVIDLYDRIGEGSSVYILRKGNVRDAGIEKRQTEAIQVLTPNPEPIVTAIPLTQPLSGEAKPVWPEGSIFRTGVDVLKEEGFDTNYLNAVPRKTSE